MKKLLIAFALLSFLSVFAQDIPLQPLHHTRFTTNDDPTSVAATVAVIGTNQISSLSVSNSSLLNNLNMSISLASGQVSKIMTSSNSPSDSVYSPNINSSTAWQAFTLTNYWTGSPSEFTNSQIIYSFSSPTFVISYSAYFDFGSLANANVTVDISLDGTNWINPLTITAPERTLFTTPITNMTVSYVRWTLTAAALSQSPKSSLMSINGISANTINSGTLPLSVIAPSGTYFSGNVDSIIGYTVNGQPAFSTNGVVYSDGGNTNQSRPSTGITVFSQLSVSGCVGTGTNYNGTYNYTGTGYFTNTTSGWCIVAPSILYGTNTRSYKSYSMITNISLNGKVTSGSGTNGSPYFTSPVLIGTWPTNTYSSNASPTVLYPSLAAANANIATNSASDGNPLISSNQVAALIASSATPGAVTNGGTYLSSGLTMQSGGLGIVASTGQTLFSPGGYQYAVQGTFAGQVLQNPSGIRYWPGGAVFAGGNGQIGFANGTQFADTNGNVTATSFSGSGSGLTNLTIPSTYALKTDATNAANNAVATQPLPATNVSGVIPTNNLPMAQLGGSATPGAVTTNNFPVAITLGNLPVPRAWWNADALVGLTNQTPINSWTDLSGNSNALVSGYSKSATFDATGWGGHPAVNFSNSFMSLTNGCAGMSNSFTWMLVYKQTVVDGSDGTPSFNMGDYSIFSISISPFQYNPSAGAFGGQALVSLTGTYSAGNGQLTAALNPTTWQPQVLLVRFDGTNIDVWQNGLYASGATLNGTTPTVWPFNSTNQNLYIGNIAENVFPWYGKLFESVIWTNSLTAQQVQVANNYAVTKYGLKISIVLDGDSISCGGSPTIGAKLVDDLQAEFPSLNVSCAAQIGTGSSNRLVCATNRMFGTGGDIIVYQIGANDVGFNTTTNFLAQTEANITNYCSLAHSYGKKVIWRTCMTLARETNTTPQWPTTLNQWARATWTNWCDGLSDVALDPILGTPGGYTNLLYFPDLTHPTNASIYMMAHNYDAPAIRKLLGWGLAQSKNSVMVPLSLSELNPMPGAPVNINIPNQFYSSGLPVANGGYCIFAPNIRGLANGQYTNWVFEVDALVPANVPVTNSWGIRFGTNNPATGLYGGIVGVFPTVTYNSAGSNIVQMILSTNLPLSLVTNCVACQMTMNFNQGTGNNIYILTSGTLTGTNSATGN